MYKSKNHRKSSRSNRYALKKIFCFSIVKCLRTNFNEMADDFGWMI